MIIKATTEGAHILSLPTYISTLAGSIDDAISSVLDMKFFTN